MNKEKKKSAIKGIKKEYIILAVLCFIAVYFLFSTIKSIDGKNKVETTTQEEYSDVLENKLKNALSKVKGAGDVTVKISFKGPVEKVYATDKTTVETSSVKKTEEKNIFVSGNLVLVNEIYPEILGVIVVSSGADNLTVRQNVMEAVVTFLNVDCSKVIILSGKK